MKPQRLLTDEEMRPLLVKVSLDRDAPKMQKLKDSFSLYRVSKMCGVARNELIAIRDGRPARTRPGRAHGKFRLSMAARARLTVVLLKIESGELAIESKDGAKWSRRVVRREPKVKSYNVAPKVSLTPSGPKLTFNTGQIEIATMPNFLSAFCEVK